MEQRRLEQAAAVERQRHDMDRLLRDIQDKQHRVSITHKVNIYLEYHSVCPLVRIGTTPPPLSQASVSSPWNKGRGEDSPMRMRWRGSPNSEDWRKSLALCQLCGITVKKGKFRRNWVQSHLWGTKSTYITIDLWLCIRSLPVTWFNRIFSHNFFLPV